MVSIVGSSNSGKTRLITKLVSELNGRGYRIATIKHAQEIHLAPGKDSQLHLAAGSEITAVATPEQVVLIKPVAAEITPQEIARIIGDDYDIILTEGYTQTSLPKIQVYRSHSGGLIPGIKKIIAIVTDEPVEAKARCFASDDIKGIADMLEEGFIKPQQQRLSLFVNGEQIMLTLFPRKIITNLLLAAVSSLKGVKKISKLDISLKNGDDIFTG